MQSKFLFTTFAAAVTLITAACGSTTPSTAYASPSSYPTSSPAAGPSPSPAATGARIATAADARLGKILVDGKGMTVYLFVADKGTASTCYTTCAQYWPPVLTNGTPIAGAGAEGSLLGTTKRTDGKVEVTYAGHPLYYFVQDMRPGQTTGQGVDGFGGLWWVLSPVGAAIKLK